MKTPSFGILHSGGECTGNIISTSSGTKINDCDKLCQANEDCDIFTIGSTSNFM
jgi:hypothetical protein